MGTDCPRPFLMLKKKFMATFAELIKNPPGQLVSVLRRYGVPGRNPDAVMAAYKVHGDRFLYDVTTALAGQSQRKSAWSNYDDGSGTEVDGPPTYDEWVKSGESATGLQKFFNLWNQALTYVGKTGEAVGKFKSDTSSDTTTKYEGYNYGWVYLVVVALVIIILLVLIFKK